MHLYTRKTVVKPLWIIQTNMGNASDIQQWVEALRHTHQPHRFHP